MRFWMISNVCEGIGSEQVKKQADDIHL